MNGTTTKMQAAHDSAVCDCGMCQWADATENRGARSLGRLDAHGLAALRTAILNVVSRDHYDLALDITALKTIDGERLAADVLREVVRMAAPAMGRTA